MKKLLRILAVLFVVMFLIIRNFHLAVEEAGTYDEYQACDETIAEDSTNANRLFQRAWEEYSATDYYCMQYAVLRKPAEESFAFRERMYADEVHTEMEFWKSVYGQLYENDKMKLIDLQDSLARIRDERQLDRDEFARLVVSFVQDIPYHYVNPHACADTGSTPCVPDIRFGIFSPVEFLYTLDGDCDTRSVLLYTLLRNFGYAPLIINSHEYHHSMLALDISASGDDFVYNGRRYAYWETTNVGWLPGMLPPAMSNKKYWTVALDYEYKTDTTRIN